MKRILLLFALCLPGLAAFAQTGAVQGHCYLGGTKALTQGLSSTNYLNGIIPGCTVTVYLHGTNPPQKAAITTDGSTFLSNPFTANVVPSVDPGGWLFFAATNQGLDVVMSGGNSNPACNTAPLCYTTPVTLVDIFPSSSFLPGTGVTSINGVQGPFTFTGNVICTGTSCNFLNGLALQHNGTPLTDQALLNFNDTTPSPPAGNTNVKFQTDGGGDLSAYVPTPPTAASQFSAYLIPPISGQYINLCSGSQAGTGSDPNQIFTTSPCGGGVSASGGPIGAPHTSQVTWSNYSLPSYVNPANVTAVYAVISMRAETSGIGAWTFFCSAQAVGTTSVTATRQFNTLLSGITGSNINSVSCVVLASHSGGNSGTFTAVTATVELFAFYTGTPPPAVNQVNVNPPLNWDSSTNILSLDIPPNTGTDSGTANNYLVTMGSLPLFIPGLTVNFLPGNSSTSTTPTLVVNGFSGTVEGPRGGALVSGDMLNTSVATVILGADSNWWLQNPQTAASASGISGMTTGQVPIAGSATTITSSKPLAGAGAGITTGPTSASSGDVATMSGTAGAIADSGKALAGAGAAVPTGPSSSTNTDCVNFTGTAGQLADSGSPCNAVSSVSNSDGTLTITPTTGAVSASLALGHANTWTGAQALGSSTATTQSAGDNSTKLATTAYADAEGSTGIVSKDTSTPVSVSSTACFGFYNNQNATAGTAVTYNLPTAGACSNGMPKQFCFTNSSNATPAPNTGVLTIATSASGQFIIFTDGSLSATGGNVTSAGAASDAACVVEVDSTHWQLWVSRGTWTKH